MKCSVSSLEQTIKTFLKNFYKNYEVRAYWISFARMPDRPCIAIHYKLASDSRLENYSSLNFGVAIDDNVFVHKSTEELVREILNAVLNLHKDTNYEGQQCPIFNSVSQKIQNEDFWNFVETGEVK